MAAYAAAKENARVTVVNKGRIQRTGATVTAPGAISAVDDRWKEAGDSIEVMVEDTMKGGAFINDRRLVETMARESAELVLELERMGCIFQRKEDEERYDLRIDGGHSFPRCPYLEDRTGKEMLKGLTAAMRALRVDLVEDVMVTSILRDEDTGAVTGACGIDLINAEPVLFDAPSVVLAAGGGGTLYENTDVPIDVTCDGHALALRAGAALRDMEFVQFYPIGFLYPPVLKGELAGLMYHCHLLNANGERFMEKYDPERLELSTRDRVSRAIITEIKEGRGTPAGGVYMDLTYLDQEFLKKATPAMYRSYLDIGKDPAKDYIDVAPTAHFMMGGLNVDTSWSSDVPGLFGAGENCGGMHGANRLSQNALAEVLVSGKHAGESAARHAAQTAPPANDPRRVHALITDKLGRLLSSGSSGIAPAIRRRRLRHTMSENAGIIRNAASLEKALREIELLEHAGTKLSSDGRYMNRELFEALENENMILTAKAVVLSALERKESRGAHFRSDFPETDDTAFLSNIIVSVSDGGSGSFRIKNAGIRNGREQQ